MRESIIVGLQGRSYPIILGAGVLDDLGLLLRENAIRAQRYAIITDDRVARLYGQRVQHSLQKLGKQGTLFTFPAGEASKRLDTISALASALAQQGFERNDAIIALGGGVSGDIAGFLAAIYLRGIDFIQVPTSLLAQVDSSVGGKTGVDIPEGKNLLGAFYQPKLVLIDTQVLHSLPNKEFLGGMAEVIKYGASMDAAFFSFLRHNRTAILALEPEALAFMIRTCCQLKAKVVEQDEREAGLRRVLNFGHTIGHAVEAASNYILIHGLAVAIGICAIAQLAVRSGHASQEVNAALQAIMKEYGLPTRIPADISCEQILTYMRSDKKSIGGRLFFVLPTTIGRVVISDQIANTELIEVLAQMGCKQ